MKRFDINKGSTSLKQATLINAGSKYAVVILSLVFSALLARILTPDDYGVLAIVTVFVNFFSLFYDMGIGPAVIQNKELTDEDTNRVFTFSLMLGLLLALVFSLFSIVLVWFYKNKVYYTVGPLLSVTLLLSTFNMVPSALLMKRKQFITSAIRTILTCVIGYAVAIVVALRGGKYYAIVCQQIVSSAFSLVWNLKTVKLRVDFREIRASINKIKRFSSFQFAFNFVNYFSRNLDNLLCGYYFGEVQVGYYDKAYKLMRYPVNNLTNVITPVLQPILSDYQNDTEYIFEKYKSIAKLLGVIAVFFSCLSFFASREIILLYFGSQWEGSVLSFHYLALSLFFQMVGGVSGSIFQSVNRTKEMFISGLIGSGITVAGILVGITTGNINGLALAYSVSFILNFLKSQWFLAHFCFQKPFWELLSLFSHEVLIAAAISLALVFIPPFGSLWLSLLVKTGAAGLVYAVMLVVTKEYRVLTLILPGKVRKFLRMDTQ